ncbi:MAG: ATP-binding cassette domain-containing protein [Synechococcaceae bacterium WB7_1B_046]|nr:ATP-binding cassette domain-containing protein [Synechococcaceae bacterium WB7_1B_046]
MTKARAAFNHSHLPVVELRGVSLNRGSRRILSDLHLQLMPGERLAIVGPSGAGKTTILRMLAGLELPTAGELLLFGEHQRYLRLDQSNPPDVRLVSQSPALLASLSVLQNVGFLLYRDGRQK